MSSNSCNYHKHKKNTVKQHNKHPTNHVATLMKWTCPTTHNGLYFDGLKSTEQVSLWRDAGVFAGFPPTQLSFSCSAASLSIYLFSAFRCSFLSPLGIVFCGSDTLFLFTWKLTLVQLKYWRLRFRTLHLFISPGLTWIFAMFLERTGPWTLHPVLDIKISQLN